MIALVKTFTNIDADSMDIDMFMLLMLNSDLEDVLEKNVNEAQLTWIDDGVMDRIDHILRKTGADRLYDKVTSILDTWNTTLSTPENIKAIEDFVAQLGKLDLTKLAGMFGAQKAD